MTDRFARCDSAASSFHLSGAPSARGVSRRELLSGVGALAAAASLGGFALRASALAAEAAEAAAPAGSPRILAAASFEAPAAILRAVAQGRAEVKTIIAAGSEPHGFEPSIRDLKLLADARVFVWNGLGMEPWAAPAAEAAGHAGLVARALAEGISAEALAQAFPKAGAAAADGGRPDPHLWLAPAGAALLAKSAAAALIAADPDGKAAYEANLAAFEDALASLSERFRERLAAAKRRVFFCGHASFGWLAREFGLEQRAASGVFAEGEPSPRRLAALIDECRRLGVKTVFAEAGESSAVLDTLAGEAGAKVAPLFTMETAENGRPYLERLSANLDAIAGSLCE